MINFEQRKAKIIAMRKKNKSLEEIGQRVGITRQRVGQILGHTGHLADKAGHAAMVKKVQALMPRYLQGKISVRGISDTTGYCYDSVNRVLIEIGLNKKAIRDRLFAQGKCHCFRCHEDKEFKEFTRDWESATGYGICKKCNAEISRLHRQKERNASGR